MVEHVALYLQLPSEWCVTIKMMLCVPMLINNYCHQGMDIPDIDLVIIYGAPSSVNQLHQVVLYECACTYPCVQYGMCVFIN